VRGDLESGLLIRCAHVPYFTETYLDRSRRRGDYVSRETCRRWRIVDGLRVPCADMIKEAQITTEALIISWDVAREFDGTVVLIRRAMRYCRGWATLRGLIAGVRRFVLMRSVRMLTHWRFERNISLDLARSGFMSRVG